MPWGRMCRYVSHFQSSIRRDLEIWLYLYIVVISVIEWCIGKSLSSSITFYSSTSITHKHNTNIHPSISLSPSLQTIISILMNPKATEKGGAIAYHFVILKLLEIADSDPELLDFYWPQIIHVHLQVSLSLRLKVV